MSSIELSNIKNDPESQIENKNEYIHEANEEDQIAKYWQKCNSDCRIIALTINCSNTLYQLRAILDPIKGSA